MGLRLTSQFPNQSISALAPFIPSGDFRDVTCSYSTPSHTISVSFTLPAITCRRSPILTYNSTPELLSQPPRTCLWSFQRQPASPRLPRPLRSSVTKISVFERLPTSSTLFLLPTPLLNAPKLLAAFLLFGEQVFQPPIPPSSEFYQLPHRRIPEVLTLTEEESRRPRQPVEGTACYPFRPP